MSLEHWPTYHRSSIAVESGSGAPSPFLIASITATCFEIGPMLKSAASQLCMNRKPS